MDICVYVHVNKIIRCEYNNGGGVALGVGGSVLKTPGLYKPPAPIHYLGFCSNILHMVKWVCSACYRIFSSLCSSSVSLAAVSGRLQLVCMPS